MTILVQCNVCKGRYARQYFSLGLSTCLCIASNHIKKLINSLNALKKLIVEHVVHDGDR